MPDVSSEVQFRISQTGAEQVTAALDQVGAATQRTAKETGNLTKFVREQRTEQRMQSFLFRETKEAIGSVTFGFMALTGAMGNATESNKRLNQTLVTGYSAFQAADFAMAGLGVASGGAALAIAGLVGGGAALLAFLDDTKTKSAEAAAEMRKISQSAGVLDAVLENRMKRLGGLSDKRLTSELNVALGNITSFEARQEDLRRALDRGEGSEQERKSAETMLGILDKRIAKEMALVQAIIKQREERGKTDSYMQAFHKKEAAFAHTAAMIGLDLTGGITGLPRGESNWLTPKEVPLDKDFSIEKSLMGALRESEMLNAKQLIFLGLLDQGVGTLRTTMSFLGVQTDSFVGKLLSALDIALSIAKTVEAISNVGSIVGALFGGGPLGAITAGVGLAGKREQFVNTYTDVVRKGLL